MFGNQNNGTTVTAMRTAKILREHGNEDHLPVSRYVHPDTFKMYEEEAMKMGFSGAACAPMVRSSYWADQQAHSAGVA
jgi:lipoate synthase